MNNKPDRPIMATIPDKPFIEACADGDANIFMIDDYIAHWHEGKIRTQELSQALGFTDEMYELFGLNRDDTILNDMVEDFKAAISFNAKNISNHVMPINLEIKRKKRLLYDQFTNDESQINITLASIGRLYMLKDAVTRRENDGTILTIEDSNGNLCNFAGFIGDETGLYDTNNRPLCVGDRVKYIRHDGKPIQRMMMILDGEPNVSRDTILESGAVYAGPFSEYTRTCEQVNLQLFIKAMSAKKWHKSYSETHQYPDASKTKVVVEVRGGLVQAVYCNDGLADVFLVDYDNLENAGNCEAEEREQIAEGENAIKQYGMKQVF